MGARSLRIVDQTSGSASDVSRQIANMHGIAGDLAARLNALSKTLAITEVRAGQEVTQQVGVQAVLCTVEEAADALRVSRTVVTSLVRAGDLRSVKIGACRRIPARAIQEYIDGLSG